ncbi:MAG TPA: DNA polymerase III subunit beta [Solirubrobacteraceae bacterium]|jgi:DNA polymerase III sliding clamp (beta) subunit (PCNA family)|nr:DNA polymerase III subunit beta [Solirubrobacteraceae bacterium]
MSSITVEPKVLADALVAVKPAVAVARVRALAGVRVTAGIAGASLTAAAADVAIKREFPTAGCDGQVDCVVSHGELVKVSKAFAGHPRVDLTVQSDIDGLQILVCSHEQRSITLQTLRLEDFPVFPETDGQPLVNANGGELAVAIERAAVFAGNDPTRPILCGIDVDWEDGLVLVATDGHRLCVIAAPGELQDRGQNGQGREHPEASNVTIGGRGLLLAAKAMRKADMVSVLTHEGHVIVQWRSNTWAIGKVVGKFPYWRELIPDSLPSRITIPLAELRSACDVAVTFLAKGTPARLQVDMGVILHGRTPNGPCFREHLKGASAQIDAEDWFEIGFEPQFLHDIARIYTSDIAVVHLNTALRPAVFEDNTDRYVLMPLPLTV